MKKKLVLLFPSVGRRVALVRAFRNAAKHAGVQCVVVGTDLNENSPALQCCDRKHLVLPVTHRGFARQMLQIIREQQVDLVIPTIDTDLPFWAARRSRLDKLGCTALVSRPSVVRICRDKRLTFEFLQKNGFATPPTWQPQKALARRTHHFPYFLKPWDGCASRGAQRVDDLEALRFYARRIPNCIVQQFVPGQEFTVDVFVDFKGNVRCVVPRCRLEVRAGEVSKAITVRHPDIIEQSQKVVEALRAGPGVITLQGFLNDDQGMVFIEINPRLGGGVPLSIKAGADFPRWLVELYLKKPVKISQESWKTGLTMLRYDDAVWLEKS